MRNRVGVFTLILFALSSFTVVAHDQVYSGRYVWGAEVNSFQPCGKAEVYWVSYNWEGPKLLDFYNTSVDEPYSPIFISFRGHLEDEELDGFATDYDGLIHVSELLELSVNIRSDCR